MSNVSRRFFAYKIALFSIFSSLTAGYVTPQFLLPDQLASIVIELANDEFLRGTKFSPAIRVGHEAIDHDIQLVLELALLSTGLSVVLGFLMNSKLSNFNIYHATPLINRTQTESLLLCINSLKLLSAISTDNPVC